MNRSRRFGFDSLEPRTLLAGSCTAVVTGQGDLVVRCDEQDNFISIEGYDGYVEIEGHEGTTINGQEEIELTGFRRDVRVSTRAGHDYVYLYELDVPGNLAVNGGGDADYLGGRYDIDVAGKQRIRVEEEGNVQQDVMQVKLNQAIQMLSRPGLAEEHYLHAIDEGLEAIYTSNLVVLPTFQDNDAAALFNTHLQMSQQLIDALSRFIDGRDAANRIIRGLGTPGSQAMAGEARNLIQVTREAMQVIGAQTNACNPQDQQTGAGCTLLQADDEAGTVVDHVLGEIFSRQVRSPFPLLVGSTSLTPDEQVILTDPLDDGQCAAIVKEIQGIKVVVSARVIPIWVEPWFARARIVGTKTVWVWEFVPAEAIKTIYTCNDNGVVNTNSHTHIILERGLMHFWRFFNKRITAVA